IAPATTLELAYIGSNSFKTVRDRQLNPAQTGPNAASDYLNLQSRRRYPSLGRIISAESSGRARVDSFQAQVRRQFSHSLMFQASYVLGKSVDNGGPSSSGGHTNPLQWARSPFARKHNAVISFSYDLPAVRIHYGRPLLSDWRVSGIAEFRSGLPLDVFQA